MRVETDPFTERTPRPLEDNADVVVIGIGNEYRSDDAVGPLIVRALKGNIPADVRLLEHSGEGAGLMDLWQGARRAILVDAITSGAPPGTIHRLDCSITPLPANLSVSSSHAFGVSEGIAAARVLGQLPEEILLYGIEASSFAPGLSPTPDVGASIPLLVQRITGEFGSRQP